MVSEKMTSADPLAISREIARSRIRGETNVERKHLYLTKNTLGVSLEQEISRRFKAKFLLPDIENEKLTLPEISVKGVGLGATGSGENPFRDHEFVDQDNTVVTVPFMASYYGACWSLTHQCCMSSWSNFEYLEDEIGVKSTVRKFFDEFMNPNNNNFYLKYWCGKIMYDLPETIANWKKAAQYTDLADNEGIRALKSLLLLPKGFDDEEEIRFVYTNWAEENDFTKTSTMIREAGGIRLFHQPFRWKEVADEIYMDHNMPQAKKEKYEERFRRIWPDCPISYR